MQEKKEEKLYFRASEIGEELKSGRKEVFKKGYSTGFHCLDLISSFAPKYTTIVYAPPHVGKSVITLDILMAQAEMGKNICIYSPEFREKAELVQALIQARLSKCFFGPLGPGISDEEYESALKFVDKHFVILVKPQRKADDSQERMSIKKIFREVKNAETAYDMKFHFLFIDPFNYIEKDPNSGEKFMDAQDYVLAANDQFAEYSKIMNIHTIISAHTRDMELSIDKETGISFYPVGHPSQIMGGQSWFRSSYQIMHFWRAPEGVINPKWGSPYEANYNKVFIQKSKPFGVGKIGNTGDLGPSIDGLYFDPDKYVMYEFVNGIKYYRNEYYKFLEESDPTYTSEVLSTHVQDFKAERAKATEEFLRKEVSGSKDGDVPSRLSIKDLGF